MSRPDRGTPEGWPLAIVFDFDYTLGDSPAGFIDCANYALGRMGLPMAGDDSINAAVGLPLEEMLVALAGEEHRGRSGKFACLLLERADAVIADATRLYDCVPNLLAALEERRVSLGIVSQRSNAHIEPVMAREGLSGMFGAIAGADTVTEPKPHPEGLLRVIAELGYTPPDALYVGDSVTDARTARDAGVRFLAVLSGVTPIESFDGCEMFSAAQSVAELPLLLDNWRGAHDLPESGLYRA